jgi:hypothetical protein
MKGTIPISGGRRNAKDVKRKTKNVKQKQNGELDVLMIKAVDLENGRFG